MSDPACAPKKLGILISVCPEAAGFQHGLGLAEAALTRGLDVYLYCIDEGVYGVDDPRLQQLVKRGLKLFACAYGAQQRGIPLGGQAVFSGLAAVSDLMASTDRFVSFN
jgi:hypothetical protein